MGSLERDTSVLSADSGLSANLSRDWEIWGPNGGYVASIALRAAGAVAPSDHRPATFSAQYLAVGQFAPVDIEADAVRKGRSAWCINVALVQGGKRLLQAQIWTTNKTDGPQKIDRTMPKVPAAAALKSWRELFPDGKPSFRFWSNFEGRPTVVLPEGTADPRGSVVQEWNRFESFELTTDPFLDFSRALILIDTYPWIAFNRGLTKRPDYIAPTLDITAWFHEPPAASQWLLVDARGDVGGGGLIHGQVQIWSDDGRPIATGGSNLLHVARA